MRILPTALAIAVISLAGRTGAAWAEPGNGGDRGGGGHVELEFSQAAEAGLAILESRASRVPEVNVQRVREAIATATLESTTDTLLNLQNLRKTALNYPTRRLIRINGDRWAQIPTRRAKMALAIHEYLGLAGYERDHYRYSTRVFDMNPAEIDFGRLAVIPSQANYRALGDRGARPQWLHLETDLVNYRIHLTNWRGDTATLECVRGSDFCRSDRDGLSTEIAKGYDISILPNGHLVVTFVHRDLTFWGNPYLKEKWQRTWVPMEAR